MTRWTITLAAVLVVSTCAACQPLPPPANPIPVVPVATVDDGCHDPYYPMGLLRWLVDFRYAGVYRVHTYPDGLTPWKAQTAGSFEAYALVKPNAWWVEWRSADGAAHNSSRVVPAVVPTRACGRPV